MRTERLTRRARYPPSCGELEAPTAGAEVDEDDGVELDAGGESRRWGNPVGIADLSAGETVLDLEADGGCDVFLAATLVGRRGRVIGIERTPEALARARWNAEKLRSVNIDLVLAKKETRVWATHPRLMEPCCERHCCCESGEPT